MIRIGLVGAGHLGKIHLQNLRALSAYFELVGVCDQDAATRQQIAHEYQVPVFQDLDALLPLVDALAVVTPTNTHFDLCAHILRKRKHLFVEKPLCNTVEEARKLLNQAREAEVKVQVGHVERFNPAFSALRSRVQFPRFIEATRLAPYQLRGTEVSVVHDLMIHDIDLILNLVKSRVKKVEANGSRVLSQSIDMANVRLEFENGAVAQLQASRLALKRKRILRVFQPVQFLEMDLLQHQAQVITLADFNEQSDSFSHAIEVGEGKPNKVLRREHVPVTSQNAIQQEWLSFYHSIQHDQKTEVQLEDGMYALEIAQQILDKMRSQGADTY
ncbi:MAG: hypothetical protein RLZZ301_1132 [Bacteroidota bacterium]|jgi:predicted dehydrogenase